MRSLITTAMGLIISLLFFNEGDFSIKYPMKVDTPLNKEAKQIYV